MEVTSGSFCWDHQKEIENFAKHGVYFADAAKTFLDPDCAIYRDERHSSMEERWFCFGKINDNIVTVRFTYRGDRIRIIGAGYWRKGRRYYYGQEKL